MLPWVVGRVEQALVFVLTLASAGGVWGFKVRSCVECKVLEAVLCVSKQKRVDCSEKQLLLVNLIVPQINAAHIF